jgi:hypothetical protein
MTGTNKWLLISESHSDSNRCIPCRGKSYQHATQISLVPMRSKQTPTPGKSIGTQRLAGLAIIPGHLILHPLQQPWSMGERVRPSGNIATLAY